MLKNLEIINGEMPLKFDPLNTIYTVNVTTKDEELIMNYEIDKKDKISIVGNNLKEGLNEVVLTVYNDLDMTSYYLYVYKESSALMSGEKANSLALEFAKEEEISEYAAPTIGVVCFLTILLTFTLLFKKKKKRRFDEI